MFKIIQTIITLARSKEESKNFEEKLLELLYLNPSIKIDSILPKSAIQKSIIKKILEIKERNITLEVEIKQLKAETKQTQ